MNFFRNQLDKVKPYAEKSKFLHTAYDAFETFLFTPKSVTPGTGAHIRDGLDLKRTMVTVVLALQLCLLFGIFNIGHQHFNAFGLYPGLTEGLGYKLLYGLLQILPMIVVVHVVGLGIEFYFASKRGHGVEEGFLVSGMLIPLIMPPDLPLWMVALSVAFAVVIAKEAFGGTGMNLMNIALTARVFVFFAYPTDISGDACWVSYDYNFLHHIFGLQHLTSGNVKDVVDGFSGATPLALAAKGGWEAVTKHYTVSQMFWGDIPGSVGEMCKPAIIVGALMLIITGIGSWQIMVSMILGLLTMGLVFNGYAATFPTTNQFLSVPFYYHLIIGSFLFAMAYMATDPVTAAQTATGKWLYGFFIGVVGMIVRVLNPAYPEGWMLAILFMNVFAPLIDHYVIEANIKRRLKRSHA
ncbi:NADH:ubiquinone reductase (Na(+)-transporting) subunit B [Sphingobacteriales bacterium UPWRP_1]|nr:NADH:ubiquinone reductase (Na(+)-transporting) subunit B [Sphingobacteriales bacterium TSM_CSS]PSJ77702.1 NADH:ubiquinone reductase (Na(+)-transporting) subunit B [Sphingobacteriales bacterium UPWRP_1]